MFNSHEFPEYKSADCHQYYKGNFQGTTKIVKKYRFGEKKCKFDIFMNR